MAKRESEKVGDEAMRVAEDERRRKEREGHSVEGQGPSGSNLASEEGNTNSIND